MAEKRYYWLKLKEDYFNNPKIKKLRRVAGGDTFTIIYLKMQLLSVSNKGIIEYESIEPTFEEELALKLDEDVEDVKLTLAYLSAQNLIENNENEFMLIEASKNIGSEVDSAERVRQFREREKQKELGYEENKKEPKSNALRQRQHQAKKRCEEKQHIPYIEDYINNKRYNGNYYLTIQRDRFKCSLCGSIENLCVHHIDGYNEDKPQNNELNKMITLCRNCHSNIHSKSISFNEDLLNSIEYYNEMLPSNNDVTPVLQNSISISNSISKSNNKDIDNILNNIEDEKLKETLIEFVKMRKSIKKPMTTHALELLIKKLNRITTDVGVQIQMLEQSILNGWQDVYELKQEVKQNNFIKNNYTKQDLSGLIADLDNTEV